MKKDPITRIWWTKIFMPHLLATQAYRKVFRIKPENYNSARANTVTNALSIGYVLVASTAAGLAWHNYRISGVEAHKTEATATFYAKMCVKGLDNPDAKVYHVKVFDGFKKEDITEEVKEAAFGSEHKNYDRYTDPVYIRKRLNVPEGSQRDEKFDVELAGVYLRRMDSSNSLNHLKKN